jgi:hypothetical protein
MSALEQLKNGSYIEGKSGSTDVEAARKELGPNTVQTPLQLADERLLPPVDGGIKAWSVIAGAYLALFVQFGLGEFPVELQVIFGPPDSSTSTSHVLLVLCFVLM